MKQLKALIVLILMAVSATFGHSASANVIIDGVEYLVNEKSKVCYARGVAPNENGEATIPAYITIDGDKYYVNMVWLNGNDKLIKLVLEGDTDPKRDLELTSVSFSACVNIQYISLPSDLKSIPYDLFASNIKLNTVVLPMGQVLKVNDAAMGYDKAPKNATVYVPKDLVGSYLTDPVMVPIASEPILRYWQSCKEIVAIQDESDPEPEPEPTKPEGVKLTTPMAHFLLANALPGHKIHVIPEEGHEISSVMWQGQDGSEFMDENNVFTVPDYTGEGNINVVMAKAGGISEIESVEADAALRVSVAGGMVKIVGAQFGQAATVTDLSGRVIYSGESREIALPEGVYLLSIAGRTFKFRI